MPCLSGKRNEENICREVRLDAQCFHLDLPLHGKCLDECIDVFSEFTLNMDYADVD